MSSKVNKNVKSKVSASNDSTVSMLPNTESILAKAKNLPKAQQNALIEALLKNDEDEPTGHQRAARRGSSVARRSTTPSSSSSSSSHDVYYTCPENSFSSRESACSSRPSLIPVRTSTELNCDSILEDTWDDASSTNSIPSVVSDNPDGQKLLDTVVNTLLNSKEIVDLVDKLASTIQLKFGGGENCFDKRCPQEVARSSTSPNLDASSWEVDGREFLNAVKEPSPIPGSDASENKKQRHASTAF